MATFQFDGITIASNTHNALKEESLTPISLGEISYYRLHLVFSSPVSPSEYVLHWREARVDVAGFWCATSDQLHISPDWGRRTAVSRTGSGMPLASTFATGGNNRLCIAHSDPATPTKLCIGAREEDSTLDICLHFFTALTQVMSEYDVVIRVDRRRDIPFYTSLIEVRDWWRELGHTEAFVPDCAKLPMYSTWYSYHQALNGEALLNECRLAKPLGMDTIIIDDGWQTDDSSRTYAYCGDWQVAEKKMGNMRALVDSIHQIGMKVILWYSIPFVGEKSAMYPRFVGKYLNYHKHLGAYSLDPRFSEVREFLIGTYLGALREFDLDGFKLDFVDAMGLGETSPTNYDDMDCRSLEEGVRRLLQETHQRLSAEKPDILIEFRQSYVGPIVSTAGNMFRVGDCPLDLIHHRSRVLDLRWTSGSTAVHSDMIIWHKEETVEAAAHQLWGTLFGVPQISVRLGEINEEHKALVQHYLAFWRAHRETILDGKLDVSAPEAWYAMASARGKDERLTALYQAVPVAHTEDIPHYVVNVTGKAGIYADLAHDASYKILSPVGTPIAEGSLKAGIHKLPVPDAGLVLLDEPSAFQGD